ncbi:AraC family transcriptional regulator [Vibrio vulnificus]|uniref:AraC family transcriptional regulator n=1 Tax=Vibrio vulnificus TaxID=672 RepID=UPI0005063996|nr:AraC family transcriptional regulator [Vibrio vulnificus]EIE1224723.1 helix-turn-helix domain-containing protein [Vibrio vulnificus]EJS4043411.1 helix-turn-helix domain-containing protein [Vibrio vulnificus]ELV8800963.1 helix-turn-helix domain-containing protein [Vibrio vulnificus]KFK55782.1 hypothetical protein JS86_07460 [Vibrio vulnificus]
MNSQADSFQSSLSLHHGWVTLYDAAKKNLLLEHDTKPLSKTKDGRLKLSELRSELYRLSQLSQDKAFPIVCADHVGPLTFGPFSLAFWTSPDLESALKLAEEFAIVIGSPIRLELHHDKEGNREVWILHSEILTEENHVTYLGMTLYIATIVRMIQAISHDSKDHLTVKVTETLPLRPVYDMLQLLTGTSTVLGSPIPQIWVSKKTLFRHNPHHDEELYFSALNLLRSKAESLKQNNLILQIYNTLNKFDSLNQACASSVAEKLLISVRTLNRRLDSINTSYRGVVDNYRKEKALHLLKTPSTNMTEIAFQLGYADLSTFSRAFKRWTGKSPMQAKNSISNGE